MTRKFNRQQGEGGGIISQREKNQQQRGLFQRKRYPTARNNNGEAKGSNIRVGGGGNDEKVGGVLGAGYK